MRERLYDKDFNIDSTELFDIKKMETIPLIRKRKIHLLLPDDRNEFYIHEFDESEKDDLDISKTFHIHAHTLYAEGKKCYGITYRFEMDYNISETRHEIRMKIATPPYNYIANLFKTDDFVDVIGCTISHDATISAADEDYDEFYDICDAIVDAYDKIFNMGYDEFIAFISAIKDTSLTYALVENFHIHITDKVFSVFASLIESLVKKTAMKSIYRMAPMEGDYLDGYYCKTNGPVSLGIDSDGIFHRDASDDVVEDDLDSDVSGWLMDKCEMPDVINDIMTKECRTRNIVYDMSIDDAIDMLTKLYSARIQHTEYNPFDMENASDAEYAWKCILDKIKLYARYTECALYTGGYHYDTSSSYAEVYDEVFALSLQSLASDIGFMNKKLDRRYVYLAYLDDTVLSEIIQPILDNKIDDEWNSKYADTFKKMTNPNTKVRYELVVD